MLTFTRQTILCLFIALPVMWVSAFEPLTDAGKQSVVAPPPAPIDIYSLHADGTIIYDPLTREAVLSGQPVPVHYQTETLVLDGMTLEVTLPTQAKAYETVPVSYTLKGATGKGPIAVAGVAFEDASRLKHNGIHDLSIPGFIDLDVEFLGSVTAHLNPGGKQFMKPDFSDEPGVYPGFSQGPERRSGVIEAGDLVWFHFRYTNTGNTILDADGFGGAMFYPVMFRKDESGEWKQCSTPYNLFYRDLENLYPGESHEIWFHMPGNNPGFMENFEPSKTPQGFGLQPGEYKFQVRLAFRDYRHLEAVVNYWDGPIAYVWEMPFLIESQYREAPVQPGVKIPQGPNSPNKFPLMFHTFEEFMTGFTIQHKPEPVMKDSFGVQVAPWTEHIVIKLIRAEGPEPEATVSIITKAIPISIDSESLSVTFNLHSPFVIEKEGLWEPVIMSQTMADMRTNVQNGPYPEKHIIDRMREMKEHGINVLATTSMPWLYNDMHNPASSYQGDAMKYSMEVARKLGLKVEIWGQYPYDRSTIGAITNWITQTQDYNDMAQSPSGYGGGVTEVDRMEPRLPGANAKVVEHNFLRWGDLAYQAKNGVVPVSMGEDTQGWMRDDVNVHYPLGVLSVAAFQNWLEKKYGNIETLNKTWETEYPSFAAIEPNSGKEDIYGLRWSYLFKDFPFWDWNAPITDLDLFRSELRVMNYRETLADLQSTFPKPMVTVRTEGGNIVVAGIDPTDRNAHKRHVYFSQRRCGLVAEVVQQGGVMAIHSDYVTIPYHPTELREMIRKAVAQGIIPAYLPCLVDMRDIVLNEKFGRQYEIHYNVDTPTKGYMSHNLHALYPWFKIMYEEGAIPGVLWEDYQCGGFVTNTQKREMKFFQEKLRKALDTPEAIKARTVNPATRPPQEWRSKSLNKRAYIIND